MIIDIHCHYTFSDRPAAAADRFSFEPTEIDGIPQKDSYISARSLKRPTWRLTKRLLGLDARPVAGPTLDAALEAFYQKQLDSQTLVERVILLAFDHYHDDVGHAAPPPASRNQLGGDIYSSNSFIRDVCRQNPDKYLFGASVHPYRANAVECVEEVFNAGACMLKWIPLHQNINVADPRTLDVMRCCSRLGLPLLIHYCEEFTLATQHPQYQPLAPLLDALRRLKSENAMPVTIVPHVATPVLPWGERRSHRELLAALVGEFADDPLYADISALTSWGKIGYLRKMARLQNLHHKFLFGSDFPVPVALPRLRFDLSSEYRRIQVEPSWIARAALICQNLGFNEVVMHRAAEILPNLDYFSNRSN